MKIAIFTGELESSLSVDSNNWNSIQNIEFDSPRAKERWDWPGASVRASSLSDKGEFWKETRQGTSIDSSRCLQASRFLRPDESSGWPRLFPTPEMK